MGGAVSGDAAVDARAEREQTGCGGKRRAGWGVHGGEARTCGTSDLELDLALRGLAVEPPAVLRLGELARAVGDAQRRLEPLIGVHFLDVVREGRLGGGLEKGLGGVLAVVRAAALLGHRAQQGRADALLRSELQRAHSPPLASSASSASSSSAITSPFLE